MVFLNRGMLLTLAALLSVLLLLIVAYGQVQNGPLVFDDHHSITHNTAIQIDALSLDSLYQAATESPLPNRLLSNLSFAINYWLDGLNPFSFHVTNLLIHVFNAFLVFLLVVRIGKLGGLTPAQANVLAILATVLWALHPIQTQAVSYIVQRMTELALTFSLLASLCYLRARSQPGSRAAALYFAATVVCGLLGLASKENAALLPFSLLLIEWLFIQKGAWPWLRRHLWLGVLLVSLLVGLGLLYTQGQLIDHVLGGYRYREFTLEERLLTEPRVVFHLLGLWFYPDPSLFNLDYDFGLSHGWLSPPTTLVATLALIALTGFGLWLAPRHPIPAFGLLWLLLWLSLESSFLPLEIIFEHRMYQPSIGLAVACAWVLIHVFNTRISLTLGIGAALVLTWSTWERNKVWADEVLLWQDVTAKSPHKSRGHSLLGTALMAQGHTEQAIHSLRKALALQPDNMNAHNNLANIYAEQGQYALAQQHLEAAQQAAPHNLQVTYNLAALALKRNQARLAVKYLKQILDADEKQPQAHLQLALIYQYWVNLSKAAKHLQAAIALTPEQPQPYILLAGVREKQNRPALAISNYQKAIKRLPPHSSEAKALADKLATLSAR